MIGFNKDLEKTQLLSGLLTPAAGDTFHPDKVALISAQKNLRNSAALEDMAESIRAVANDSR